MRKRIALARVAELEAERAQWLEERRRMVDAVNTYRTRATLNAVLAEKYRRLWREAAGHNVEEGK